MLLANNPEQWSGRLAIVTGSVGFLVSDAPTRLDVVDMGDAASFLGVDGEESTGDNRLVPVAAFGGESATGGVLVSVVAVAGESSTGGSLVSSTGATLVSSTGATLASWVIVGGESLRGSLDSVVGFTTTLCPLRCSIILGIFPN